jgi:hypothetical protein
MDVGEDFGCGLGETGDLPGLNRIEKLLAQTIFQLMYVFANRRHDRKRVEFPIILPHEKENVQALFGQRAMTGNALSLGQGAGNFFVPALKPDQITFVVDFNPPPGIFNERHFAASDPNSPQRAQRFKPKVA